MVSILRSKHEERRACFWLVRLLAFLFFGLGALGDAAQADSITVVLSGHARPYLNMAEVLQQKLAKQGREISIQQLDTLDEDRTFDADLFIGVGSGAARWLYENLPQQKSMVYCLAPKSPSTNGRAVHGVVTEVPLEEQFTLIQEALPKARTVGVLYRSDGGAARLARLEKALPKNVTLHAVAIDQHRSFASALNKLFDQEIDIIWTEPDPEIYVPAAVRSLLLAALRRRVPVFGFSANFVRSGSLLGVQIELNEYSEQVARLCEELLRGGQVALDSPEPLRPAYHVAVNLVVARKLSIRLPESLIERAEILSGP